MPWIQPVTHRMADFLRFGVRAALLIDGIALTLSSIYVVMKLCWFSIHYLDRTLFAEPW